MVFRSMVLTVMLLSLLGGGWAPRSTQAAYQVSPHSIALGPDQTTAGPGEFVEYTTSVRSLQEAFSGFVLVVIPDGLTVTGQPYCQNGCGQPTVDVGTDGTQIEASIDVFGDESASLSFQVMVDTNATVGTSYGLTAYLLGGVNTAGSSETAFATLTVTDAAPDSGPLDDRHAYLDVTPRLLRVAPGGSALYFIQPGFWGDWSANLPDYTVELQLPTGVGLPSEPICGPRQSVVPEVTTCDAIADEQGDGSIIVTARPGFVGENSNGLYVTAAFEANLPVDTLLQIDVSLSVPGDVPASAQHEQSLGALVGIHRRYRHQTRAGRSPVATSFTPGTLPKGVLAHLSVCLRDMSCRYMNGALPALRLDVWSSQPAGSGPRATARVVTPASSSSALKTSLSTPSTWSRPWGRDKRTCAEPVFWASSLRAKVRNRSSSGTGDAVLLGRRGSARTTPGLLSVHPKSVKGAG